MNSQLAVRDQSWAPHWQATALFTRRSRSCVRCTASAGRCAHPITTDCGGNRLELQSHEGVPLGNLRAVRCVKYYGCCGFPATLASLASLGTAISKALFQSL